MITVSLKLKPIFFLIIALFSTAPVFAQDDGSKFSNVSSSLNLGYSSELGGFYYQDVSGLELAVEGVPYEGVVDKSSYVLGINDLITIEVSSINNMVLRSIIVNTSGDVVLPSIGSVNIANKSIQEAERVITDKLQGTFKDPIVSISLEIPRPVTIHIAGSIPFPGKYVVPAQSRVDIAILQSIIKIDVPASQRAIFLPNYTSQLLTVDTYSFRNIEILHTDGSVLNADLINYFRTGDLDSNPIVKDGDKIILKRRNRETPTLSISGAVSFGYELEYKKGDTPYSLIQISGGFEEDADTSKVFVFRQENSGTVKNVVPNTEWSSFKLNPNDRVIVPKRIEVNKNSTVNVKGEVNIQGTFPIISGVTTAAELMELTGGLTNNALPNAAYLIRGTGLENEIPNKFNAELMKRTSDQLLQGLDYLSMETSLSQNRVYINLTDVSELSSLTLFDGDRLYVPRNEHTIFVFGQVNKPGYFPIQQQSTHSVFDFINKAGGYALSADRERVFIIKAGSSAWYIPGETSLESGDKIFVDKKPVEELNALRTYEIQKKQIRNTRVQLIMTGITTITGIITTYVAITR